MDKLEKQMTLLFMYIKLIIVSIAYEIMGYYKKTLLS